MKESTWGVFLVTLGIIGIGVLNILQSVTTTNENNYYLLREVTESSMFDALDLGHYRRTGEIKIMEEKFTESFLRRFSASFNRNDNYTVGIYEIIEVPPKVSLIIGSGQYAQISSYEGTEFNINNRIDAILETKFPSTASTAHAEPEMPGPFTSPAGTTKFRNGYSLNIIWGATSSFGVPASNGRYRLEAKCDEGNWTYVQNATYTNVSPTVSCAGSALQYRVRTESDAGLSNWVYSEIIGVYVPPVAPQVPGPFTSPVATTQFRTNESLNVIWGATSSFGSPNTGGGNYRLETRCGTGNWILVLTTTGTSTVNTASCSSSTLQYRVRAQNDITASGWRYSDVIQRFVIPPTMFAYTGNVQQFAVPLTGVYKLEAWGAQGGYGYTSWFSPQYSSGGGYGAYATGNIKLNAGQTIYVYVGGSPGQSNIGGYNGGGNSHAISWSGYYTHGGGGGGATDFRTVGGAWNNSTSLNSRILVAGGGGGSTNYTNSYTARAVSSYYTYGYTPTYPDGERGGQYYYDNAGRPSNYGDSVYNLLGQAGQPGALGRGGQGANSSYVIYGNYISSIYGDGGGGGYYGGGGGASGAVSYSLHRAYLGGTGGGGSSYTNGMMNANSFFGGDSMPNQSGGSFIGNTGHGVAKISYFSD